MESLENNYEYKSKNSTPLIFPPEFSGKRRSWIKWRIFIYSPSIAVIIVKMEACQFPAYTDSTEGLVDTVSS